MTCAIARHEWCTCTSTARKAYAGINKTNVSWLIARWRGVKGQGRTSALYNVVSKYTYWPKYIYQYSRMWRDKSWWIRDRWSVCRPRWSGARAANTLNAEPPTMHLHIHFAVRLRLHRNAEILISLLTFRASSLILLIELSSVLDVLESSEVSLLVAMNR